VIYLAIIGLTSLKSFQ